MKRSTVLRAMADDLDFGGPRGGATTAWRLSTSPGRILLRVRRLRGNTPPAADMTSERRSRLRQG